ncbi:hypothetical protein Ciccas_002391 [Cichlidogyrus casuarinus]|uniref:Uncharacterized protein n=1 Tax=Cichlidogyrus casuarinus TaxID=1844966 RepID=A0ABD2QHC9_9PLAT
MTSRKDSLDTERFRSGPNSTPTSLPVHKIVMLGKGGVGKSTLLKRLMYDEFFPAYKPTVDDTYSTVARTMDGSFTQFELIDTSGNYCFSAMRQLRLKIARVIVLIFSLNDESSLEEVGTILQEIVQLQRRSDHPPGVGPSQRVIMVANQQDSKDEKSLELQRRAQDLLANVEISDLHYLETSAYTGFNVVSLFFLVFEPALMNGKEEQKLSRPSKFMSIFSKTSLRRLSSREQASTDEDGAHRIWKRSRSVTAECANRSSITDEVLSSGFFSAESDTKSMQETLFRKIGIDLTKEIGRNLDPCRKNTDRVLGSCSRNSSATTIFRRTLGSDHSSGTLTPLPKRRAFSVFTIKQKTNFHLKIRNLSIF